MAPAGDVPGHHRAGADRRPGADPDAAEDRRAGADRGAALDHGPQQLPVGLALQLAVGVGRPRALVVDEDDPVADEDLVLDPTPSQMKVWLWILQAAPISAPRWISTKVPIRVPAPIRSRRGW